MAAPFLFKGLPLLRLHHHRQLLVAVRFSARRLCSSAPDLIRPDDSLSSTSEKSTPLSFKQPPKLPNQKDPDYCKWENKQEEILKDIEPIVLRIKSILHSKRYVDGGKLDEEDEIAVVEKLLAYHPESEDKIGCGIDSIMVDRHPIYQQNRCLFVVRTDGGWIDFSYRECIREYVRRRYPSVAERFNDKHFHKK